MYSLVMVILCISISFIFLYFLFLVLIILGWENAPRIKTDEDYQHFISVIIPVRNEESGIGFLIESLEKQKYPVERFEVLIIDDHSTDHTREYVNALKRNTRIQLRLFRLPGNPDGRTSPKKRAITFGIEKARGELIVLTDGDCRAAPGWLAELENVFRKTGSRLVSGPVFVEQGDSFARRLQSIEFSSLMGTGAALIYWQMPVMCNGANLAFSKSVFVEVGGYRGNENIISGDDEFLMYKIYRKYPRGIYFLKSSRAQVRTLPLENLRDFISQRKRWAGKWKSHTNVRSTFLAVFIFAVHLSFIFILITTILGKFNLMYFCGITIVKISAEYLFINRIFMFFKEEMKLFPFVVSSLFYSFYALFFGILANTGRYTWKERKFKS